MMWMRLQGLRTPIRSVSLSTTKSTESTDTATTPREVRVTPRPIHPVRGDDNHIPAMASRGQSSSNDALKSSLNCGVRIPTATRMDRLRNSPVAVVRYTSTVRAGVDGDV